MKEDDSVKMQELDDYNERVDNVHEMALRLMLTGGAFWISGFAYTIDDFACNFDIDSELFRSWLKEDCQKFKESTNDKLSDWCRNLAIQYIAYE